MGGDSFLVAEYYYYSYLDVITFNSSGGYIQFDSNCKKSERERERKRERERERKKERERERKRREREMKEREKEKLLN